MNGGRNPIAPKGSLVLYYDRSVKESFAVSWGVQLAELDFPTRSRMHQGKEDKGKHDRQICGN